MHVIGEHLDEIPLALREIHRVLRTGERLVFSVYHPEMAAAGKEANFERSGVEYRLGAYRYSVADYAKLLEDAGFEEPSRHEFTGDEQLVRSLPSAAGMLGFPVLLVLEAREAFDSRVEAAAVSGCCRCSFSQASTLSRIGRTRKDR